MRLILYFALAMIAIYLLRRALARAAGHDRQAPGESPPEAERMVACAHCGVHVPESECLRAGDAVYCSAEHRRLHEDGGA